MPEYTNGVYQDKSVPNKKMVGVGTGLSNSGNKNPGMPDQYSPASPSYGKPSMDGCGDKTYSK